MMIGTHSKRATSVLLRTASRNSLDNSANKPDVSYRTTTDRVENLPPKLKRQPLTSSFTANPSAKDSLSSSQDPFMSISRAIHKTKLTATSRLRIMSTNSRHRRRTCISDFSTMSGLFIIALFSLTLIFIVHSFISNSISQTNLSSWYTQRPYSQETVHSLHSSPSVLHALKHRPPSTSSSTFVKGPWVIALIADLDKESCRNHNRRKSPSNPVPCRRANSWVSYFKRAVLSSTLEASTASESSLKWIDEVEIESSSRLEVQYEGHSNFGKRAMELSELEWFFGRLLTPDDRTGSLLEIVSPRGQLPAASATHLNSIPSSITPSVVRRAILHDGAGDDVNSSFKSEWMAIKDEKLMIGSHGRPYTDPQDGRIVKSNNPKWIKVVDRDFTVTHVNWTTQYDAISASSGISFPGYLMHEAVLWSQERRVWMFLPRRRSETSFNSHANERKGTNMIITASEDFKNITAVRVTDLKDPSGLRGFSSAKFIPGTRDRVLAALRTVETDPSTSSSTRETATYFSVFEIPSGRMIHKEEKVSDKKFEGLVFL